MEIEVKPLTANIEIEINNDFLADKVGKLQQEISELEAEKERLEALAKETQEELETLTTEKERLDALTANLETENTELKAEKERLNSLVAEMQGENAELQAEIIRVDQQLSKLKSDLDLLNGETVENPSSYALETKNLIGNAIQNKGGIITEATPFRAYADVINNFTLGKTGDPHTLLLMHFDESATKDDSIYADMNTIVERGTPSLSTSIKKFGKSSLYLNGSSNLYFQDKAFPRMNGNIFTIEFWLYKTAAFSNALSEIIFGQASQLSGFGWPTGWGFGRFLTTSSGEEVDLRCASRWSMGFPCTQFTTNTWHHIALSRNVDKAYVFLDGVLMKEQTLSHSGAYTSNLNFEHTHFSIGSLYWNGSYYLRTSYIDEFRISDVCRYTTDFTPPTEPFTI